MNKTNEIETVAAELGYTESMECSALDYIIETAKASVMVNQKNVELVAHVSVIKKALELAKPHVRTCYKQGHAEWSDFERVSNAIESTPAQCLNQIKAEAVLPIFNKLKAAHGSTTHRRAKEYLCEEAFELAGEVIDSASIAKGEL